MSQGLRLLHSLIAMLIVVCVAKPAWAAPPGPNVLPVHVVAVKSDDALDQAEALTVALRKAVRDSEGWSLGDSEQSLEFLALKMECKDPIDAACESGIADVLKADRYIYAVIAFDGADQVKVKGSIKFFVRGEATKSHAVNYSANLTDATADALIKIAGDAVAAVTGGAPEGMLKVSNGGIAGEVFIDGASAGDMTTQGATFTLPAGDHDVMVKSDGYEDAIGRGTVKPKTTTEVKLTMVALPEPVPLDGMLIGGIGVLAVGVGAGAVGLWASLEVQNLRTANDWTDFLATVPKEGNKDACQAARDGIPGTDYGAQFGASIKDFQQRCDQAETREVLQAVMYPIAGVAAAVGLYLIIASDTVSGGDGEDSAFSVTPIITPDVGALTVSYSF